MMDKIIYELINNTLKGMDIDDLCKTMDQNIKEYLMNFKLKDVSGFDYNDPTITDMLLYTIYKAQLMKEESKRQIDIFVNYLKDTLDIGLLPLIKIREESQKIKQKIDQII